MKLTWNPQDYSANASAQQSWALELVDDLHLRDGQDVLDVGCGDGKITAALADMTPHGSALGVDSSETMITLARERHMADRNNLRFEFGDASRLEFTEAFDAVFSNSVLHWLVDHRPAIRGICRALRPGGRAALRMGGKGAAAEAVTTFNGLIRDAEWSAYFRDFDFRYGFYAPDEYRGWLNEAGLRPVRVELMPRIMEHTREGFTGWIRTTWMGYTQRVPEAEREHFVEAFTDRYLAEHGGTNDCVRVTMTRLDVVAVRA